MPCPQLSSGQRAKGNHSVTTMSLSLPVRHSFLLTVRFLSIGASSVCLWLFWQKLNGGISSIAGCGGEGGCAQVMGGAWSEWFYIPVTVLAAAVYLAVLILTFPSVQQFLGRTGDQLLAAAGVVLIAAAVYFLVILYAVEKNHCPWCLGLHVTGIVAGALLLTLTVGTQHGRPRSVLEAATLTGFMAIGVLAAGQVWGPKPDTHLVTSGGIAAPPNNVPGHAAPASLPPGASGPASGRVVDFFDGRMRYDAANLPILGSPEARVVLVEFFDYTCGYCRDLAGHLKALKRKWPDTFGIVTLPSPINRACNPFLRDHVRDHEGACELARLSLALWRAKPSAFPAFHDYLLGLPLPAKREIVESARRKADELAGASAMNAAMDDPWVTRQLNENIGSFAKLTTQSIVMPKLLLHTSVMMHGPPRNTEEFIKVIEQQFDLTGKGSPVVSKPR
jgi:uncharacterized membrane protein/thiol-disulfide isomerase/thioredoxin